MAKQYWLMKTEPAAWSWQDQLREETTYWDGVRNYQAANNLKAMRVGDEVFFYESQVGKCIRGIMQVVREAYPDPTDKTGQWVVVDVKPIQTVITPITLADIKANPALANLALIRQSRLSVMPVGQEEWKEILKMQKAISPSPKEKGKRCG